MQHEQNGTKFDNIPLGMDEVDQKIVIQLIENPSITDEKLAKSMGISRQTVNRRRNSLEVRKSLAMTLALPTTEMKRLIAKALNIIESHLDDPDPRTSLYAATQLLKFGSEYYQQSSNSETVFSTAAHSEIDVTEADIIRLEKKIMEKLKLQSEALEPISINELDK